MDEKTMKAMLSTLNGIEVHGKENMQALLGCIWALENAAAAQPKEETNGGQVD